MTKIRTGQAPAALMRAQFHERFNVRFYDPAFDGERAAIARLEEIAGLAVQEEVRNVARSVVRAVKDLRAGRLSQPDRQTQAPRPK